MSNVLIGYLFFNIDFEKEKQTENQTNNNSPTTRMLSISWESLIFLFSKIKTSQNNKSNTSFHRRYD